MILSRRLLDRKTLDFAGLYKALTVLGVIFLAGVIATFIYTRMMVYIGQGVLKRVRDDMFEHMQTLPIRRELIRPWHKPRDFIL